MKKILFGMAVALAAFSSQAAYLFWQVSDATVNNDAYLKSQGVTTSGDYYARLRYGTGDEYVNWATWSDSTPAPINVALGGDGSVDDAIAVNLASLGADSAAYSFYIEIVNYNAGVYNTVAKSEIRDYTSLASNNYIVDFDKISMVAVWTGGAYSVPEPTSAMLLFVGMAFLGLRRRRA